MDVAAFKASLKSAQPPRGLSPPLEALWWAGKDAQGLPLGLQLIGRPFDEETLFSLGEVVEQAAGRFTPARWW